MSGPEIDFQIVVFGTWPEDWKDIKEGKVQGPIIRTMEANLRPRVPTVAMLQNNEELDKWQGGLIEQVSEDCKYSFQWCCEYCDKPAREVVGIFGDNPQGAPWSMHIHMHQICDGVGPCVMKLRQLFILQKVKPPPFMPRLPNGALYPLSSCCASCQDAEGRSRCARCKMARYCGSSCQKADWKRHKDTCKMVKDIQWKRLTQ